MLYSYEWLKQFVPNIPEAEELAEKLTLHTVEVEEVIDAAEALNGIVVAEVTATEKHPDADRLAVCTVNTGSEELQVVCGGSNVVEGHRYAFAPVGTQVRWHGEGDLITLEKAKIRGVESSGMICAAEEIGLGEQYPKKDEKEVLDITDHAPEAATGTPLAEALNIGGALIDIDNKSMTHRPDLFSHRGMGREIAAVCDVEFKDTTIPDAPEKGEPSISVKVKDEDLCARYAAVEMEVTIGETPADIAQRLAECDVKRINNVVDITNYVMCELGQPLHAFDADTVESGNIIVRRAKKGEKLLTLDNEEKELNDSILVIADKKKPLAIAGIIGGKDTGVSEGTKRIILEIATFDPVVVRKGTQQLGVRTDSALRYEKGLPVYAVDDALARAVELLQEHASGKLIGMVDTLPTAEDTTLESVAITLEEIARATGKEFAAEEITDYMQRLECAVAQDGNTLSITPPLHRTDLHIPEDIIEEIAKIYGVNNLPDQQLTGVLNVPVDQPYIAAREATRKLLDRLGCSEIYSYSLYGEDLIQKVGFDPQKDHIEIANPLSEDVRYLRISLLPRMLENIARNSSYAKDLQLYELGHVFFSDKEVPQLAIAVTGENAVQRARGIAEAYLHKQGLVAQTEYIQQEAVECLYWGQYAGNEALRYDAEDGVVLGTLGAVDSEVLEKFSIEGDVAFAIFSMNALSDATSTPAVEPISQFPAITIDLSFVMPKDLLWSNIEEGLHNHFGALLRKVEVFDVYTGDKLPAGTKSVAFSLTLQSEDETLAMKRIEELRDAAVQELNKQHGIELRDK